MATVGTTATQIHSGSDRIVLRNLGPGNVGLGRDNTVTVANADIYLEPKDAFEFPADLATAGWTEVFAIADAAGTDLRVAVVS